MSTEIFNIVKDIIISNKLNSDERVEESSHLIKDLHMDSAFLIKLALNIEQKFDIGLSDDELLSVLTVKELVRFIEQKTKKR